MNDAWIWIILTLIPVGLLAHVGLFLVGQTYPSIHIWIGNKPVWSLSSLIDTANIKALVTASAHAGNDRIVSVTKCCQLCYPRHEYYPNM